MKSTNVLVGVAAVVALAGASWAQPTMPDIKKPEIKKPEIKAPEIKVPEAKMPELKQPEAPKMPEGMPDMKAMMEAWEKASTPNDNHAAMAKHAGTWDGKVTMWMMPGQPPSESTCKTTMEMVLGGRFLHIKTAGEMPGMGPFEGIGYQGYNTVTNKIESVWMDNAGTMMLIMSGTCSEDHKVQTLTGTMMDPMTHKASKVREVHTILDDNTQKLEMFGTGPDGAEMKMMQIDYTRASN